MGAPEGRGMIVGALALGAGCARARVARQGRRRSDFMELDLLYMRAC